LATSSARDWLSICPQRSGCGKIQRLRKLRSHTLDVFDELRGLNQQRLESFGSLGLSISQRLRKIG
jgi:hypothetical protein